jgi:hypothetical protein
MENLEKVKQHARDLRREEPRSPGEKLAGYELAARCLDKCRASILGWQGDFMFNCPMDQQFLTRAEIDAGDFKDFVATGASDAEVERWIKDNARPQGA